MLLKEKLKNYQVVLVSNSPRRKELLKGLEIDFMVTSVDIHETFPKHLIGQEIPIHIAQEKAKAYVNQLLENTLAITADTIVLLENKVLGKPKDRNNAKEMLRQLSGQTHDVITGVCLFTKNKKTSFSSTSKVTFKELTDEEIEHYLSVYQPYDKAGSYGVLEWIGFIGIERIEGSYFNVMGLPTVALYKELEKFICK